MDANAAVRMRGSAVELRPGVFRPDWSVAGTAAAQQALGGRAARSGLIDRWLHALTPDQDRVWRTVLHLYADLGRAPRIEEIGAAANLSAAEVRPLLQQLEDRDLLALGSDGETLRHAYPFSAGSTGHRVALGRHTLNSMCAIDALGTGAMYGRDVEIDSRCRFCGDGIRIVTAEQGMALDAVLPAGAVVWYDLAYGDSAAISCCPTIAFFCSDEHLARWLEAQTDRRYGMRLSITEAHEVGQAIFGPVLRPPAQPTVP
jgi:alkylmercury lyase